MAKAAELKKIFEEGVAASKASNHDVAIEKFTAAAALMPNCYDCYYNIGYAYLQKKDEKQAEAAWLKALELKPDYPEALNALATLYNNQKRFDEAAAMGAKAAAAGGAGGGSADAVYNQGIILWNQGKIPEAKAKFEEALKANPNHAGIELPARDGAPQRRQDAGSHRGVRKVPVARSRRAVRRPGQGDARAAQEVGCLRCLRDLRCLRCRSPLVSTRSARALARRLRARAARPPTSDSSPFPRHFPSTLFARPTTPASGISARTASRRPYRKWPARPIWKFAGT